MARIIRYLEAAGQQTAGWHLYVDGTLEGSVDFAEAGASQFGGQEVIWLDGATPANAGTLTGGGDNDHFLIKAGLDADVVIHDAIGENLVIFDIGFIATKVEIVSVNDSIFGTLEELHISFASPDDSATTRTIIVKSLDAIKFQLGSDGTATTAADFASAHSAGFTVVAPNIVPIITDQDGGDDSAFVVNVAENVANVTTIVATDGDNDALSYVIVGGADAALFAIDENSGVLRFISAPDFDTPTDNDGDNDYEIIVSVSDGNGGNDTVAVVVRVSDENDIAPIFSSGETATALVENAAIDTSTPVYTAVAAADVVGDTIIWSLSGADAGLFDINSDGEVTFKASTTPDYETKASYRFNVVAAVGAQSTTQDVTIAVTDGNDAPLLVANNVVTYASSGRPIILGIRDLLVRDEDVRDTITFTIIAAPASGTLKLSGVDLADGDTFTMDDVSTGKISYAPAQTPADSSFTFTYGDGTDVSPTQTFNFDVRERATTQLTENNALDLSTKTAAQEIVTDDGRDDITDGQGNDYIETGRGDDTIRLSSGGEDIVAYNFDVADDESVVATDGNNRISGFTRGEDEILFKTDEDEDAITSLNAFLKDGQGVADDNFADDKFLITIDYEITRGTGGEANSLAFTGLVFHFRESAVYGGNKLSMPIFEIGFASPITGADLFAAIGDVDNLDVGRGLALKKLVEVDSGGNVTENYVANILGVDSIDFTTDTSGTI